MLKTKHALSALCMLVAMTMATSAFAQGIFSVSSSVEPRARLNGNTERAGGVTLTQTSGKVDLAGTVTIDYAVAITNDVGADGIAVKICGQDGKTGAAGDTTVGDTAITVEVNISAQDECSIDVSGVRLGIAGSGSTAVSASISSSGNIRLAAGANRVVVINSVVDELTDAGVKLSKGGKATLVRHTAKTSDDPAVDGTFSFEIKENAVDSFEGAELVVDFTGLPTGASIVAKAYVGKIEDAAPKDNSANTDAVPGTGLASSVDDNTVTFSVFDQTAIDKDGKLLYVEGESPAGTFSSSKVDTVIVTGTISFDMKKASLPLVDLDVQATVDVGPIGPAKPAKVKPVNDIPRFDSDPTTGITIVDVESAQTTLNAPYALATQGFDTGFAISNMNTDDDQAGAITFMLYQNGDDVVEYTTSAGSPGRGLKSGMLEAGATYAVLLTEILDAAEVEGGFSGYVMIVTDFTGADGIAYISDWAAFSATATLKSVE